MTEISRLGKTFQLTAALLVVASLAAGTGSARADSVDYSVTAGARSLPIAGAVWAEAGYDVRLWGEKKAPGDFLYGYLRPSALLATSGVVDRAEASLEIFPISLAGVSFNFSDTARLSDTSGMDCVTSLCTGWLSRASIRPAVAVGFGPWFLTAAAKWEWESAGSARSFVDEYDVLVGAPGGDELIAGDAWTGVALDDVWSVGLHAGVARMATAGDANDSQDLFVRRTFGSLFAIEGPWSAVAGAGPYRSDFQQGFAVYGQLKWTGAASLALF